MQRQLTAAQKRRYESLVIQGAKVASISVDRRLAMAAKAAEVTALGKSIGEYAKDLGIGSATLQSYFDTWKFWQNDRMNRGLWIDYQRSASLAAKHPNQ